MMPVRIFKLNTFKLFAPPESRMILLPVARCVIMSITYISYTPCGNTMMPCGVKQEAVIQGVVRDARTIPVFTTYPSSL
jgi:hypothetical protein